MYVYMHVKWKKCSINLPNKLNVQLHVPQQNQPGSNPSILAAPPWLISQQRKSWQLLMNICVYNVTEIKMQ